jgi:hypothetical protein
MCMICSISSHRAARADNSFAGAGIHSLKNHPAAVSELCPIIHFTAEVIKNGA